MARAAKVFGLWRVCFPPCLVRPGGDCPCLPSSLFDQSNFFCFFSRKTMAERRKDAFKPQICNKVAAVRRLSASRGCTACFLASAAGADRALSVRAPRLRLNLTAGGVHRSLVTHKASLCEGGVGCQDSSCACRWHSVMRLPSHSPHHPRYLSAHRTAGACCSAPLNVFCSPPAAGHGYGLASRIALRVPYGHLGAAAPHL